METNEIGTLDEILIDMTLFGNPNLLRKEHINKINNHNINKVKLKEYYIFLTSIKQACKKVLRYEIYFAEFYPKNEEKIKNSEALKHHIHAYLEDLDILKEKLKNFLGTFKHDIKKVASNSEEVTGALQIIISKVYETFNNVSVYRNPHHHQGMEFTDGNLVDSEMAHTLLKKDNPLHDSFKPDFLKELEVQEKKSFEKAREAWIERARQNNPQIMEFINMLFDTNKEALYQFLQIKSVKDLIK